MRRSELVKIVFERMEPRTLYVLTQNTDLIRSPRERRNRTGDLRTPTVRPARAVRPIIRCGEVAVVIRGISNIIRHPPIA